MFSPYRAHVLNALRTANGHTQYHTWRIGHTAYLCASKAPTVSITGGRVTLVVLHSTALSAWLRGTGSCTIITPVHIMNVLVHVLSVVLVICSTQIVSVPALGCLIDGVTTAQHGDCGQGLCGYGMVHQPVSGPLRASGHTRQVSSPTRHHSRPTSAPCFSTKEALA